MNSIFVRSMSILLLLCMSVLPSRSYSQTEETDDGSGGSEASTDSQKNDSTEVSTEDATAGELADADSLAKPADESGASTDALNGSEEPSKKGDVPKLDSGPKPKKKKVPINFRATETFITEYVGDNGDSGENAYGDDDNYWNIKNLLYLQASNRYFDSAMRLDLNLYHHPPRRATYEQYQDHIGGQGYGILDYGNDFRVERIHGTAHIKNLHVTAGDFYVSFGRGMVLSLIKMDDTGVDNALRGGRIELRIPRKLKLTLVGGVTNTLNVEPITKSVLEDDPLDRLIGGRIEWEVMDAMSIGAHSVFMRPRFDNINDIDDPRRLYVDQGPGVGVISGGGSVELHLGGAHVYLEGNGQVHDNYRPAPLVGLDTTESQAVEGESGMAFFAEASYDWSPFMLTAEGIFYRRWLMEGPNRSVPGDVPGPAVPYHHMITLEPVWMVIKSLGNAEGGRITGDYYIKKTDTALSLMTAVIMYEGGLMPTGKWEDHPPTLIVHPLLTVRQTFGKSNISLALEGGYRFETTEEPEGEGDTGYLWHGKLDLTVPISGPHSIEAKSELRRHSLHITEGNQYWVLMSSLGYEWSGLFGMTFSHEYSDETAGSETKMGSWTLPFPEKHYMWAMLSLHPPKPLDDLSIRIFGGSQRGGIKCAGGVCREYPDSVGAKLEAVYRF